MKPETKQKLFDFFRENYEWSLLDSEMQEIENILFHDIARPAFEGARESKAPEYFSDLFPTYDDYCRYRNTLLEKKDEINQIMSDREVAWHFYQCGKDINHFEKSPHQNQRHYWSCERKNFDKWYDEYTKEKER